MVRSLVELHEGTAKAYSAGPNQGSEFVVYLPLEEENKKEIADNKVVTPEENFSLANLRVLIVDDNFDITNSLAMLLNSWEIKVHVANNGKSALAVLDEFIPHVVLLDIGMSDMDGYEVAEKIRQNPQHASIKLVALTGWSQEKDRLKSRASGFNEHLAKPVDINVLKKLLSKLAPRP
jgi:CheY-like chemotaxis protein